ncbi:MAG: sulfate ABC transporter substrate-binding protein [Eubacterium sp.]|nr:sulfate ABC transporter substrate-binding protein [Eubacterium sp.]
MRLKSMRKIMAAAVAGVMVAGLAACGSSSSESGSDSSSDTASSETITLTNVSYDPTRELYEAYNELFESYYKDKTGTDVDVVQSHGGSGSQARSVVEGADADVVTLALEHDITLIEQAGLIDSGWLDEFDESSSPYTSTIVFLVRKGNEKNIQDWDDLVKDGVDVITPDPKSSGGACWNFLAAWEYASNQYDNDETKVKSFMSALYANVSVMDSGARGATTTFVENGQGDVLIAWENEAIATVAEYPDEYEIVSPSISILAQPSVAVVDANAEDDGTQEVASEYLSYLYSDEAQKIIGENGYRPSNEEILSEYSDKFDLDMQLCTIEDFGGWDAAYETFFNDGAIFDEIYEQ